MSGDAKVVVEEHPELDNPLGKAEGAVEAAETMLSEQKDIAARLAGKVETATAAVTMAKEQHKAAIAEIKVYEKLLADAHSALARIEGT